MQAGVRAGAARGSGGSGAEWAPGAISTHGNVVEIASHILELVAPSHRWYANRHPESRLAELLQGLSVVAMWGTLEAVPPRIADHIIAAIHAYVAYREGMTLVQIVVVAPRDRLDIYSERGFKSWATETYWEIRKIIEELGGDIITAVYGRRQSDERCIHIYTALPPETTEAAERMLRNSFSIDGGVRIRYTESLQHMVNTLLYLAMHKQRLSPTPATHVASAQYAIEVPHHPKLIAAARRLAASHRVAIIVQNGKIYLAGRLRHLLQLQPKLSRLYRAHRAPYPRIVTLPNRQEPTLQTNHQTGASNGGCQYSGPDGRRQAIDSHLITSRHLYEENARHSHLASAAIAPDHAPETESTLEARTGSANQTQCEQDPRDDAQGTQHRCNPSPEEHRRQLYHNERTALCSSQGRGSGSSNCHRNTGPP